MLSWLQDYFWDYNPLLWRIKFRYLQYIKTILFDYANLHHQCPHHHLQCHQTESHRRLQVQMCLSRWFWLQMKQKMHQKNLTSTHADPRVNLITPSDCAVIDALNDLHHQQGAVWKWVTTSPPCTWFISGETLNFYFESSCMANQVALTLPLLFSCSWSGHHHGAATLLSPKIQYVCDVQWGPLLSKTCNYFPPLICKKTEYDFTYRSDTLMFVEVHGSKTDTRQAAAVTLTQQVCKNRLINATHAA